MGDDLEALVQRMIDAGESEENIASVIKEYRATDQPTKAATTGSSVPSGTIALGAGLGAMRVAPAVLSAVNAAARLAGPAAKIAGTRYAPIAAIPTAAYQASKGDVGGAALTAGTAAAVSQIPRMSRAVQMATGPASALGSGVGLLSRLASKAGPYALGASLLMDLGNYASGKEAEVDPLIAEFLKRQFDQPLR